MFSRKDFRKFRIFICILSFSFLIHIAVDVESQEKNVSPVERLTQLNQRMQEAGQRGDHVLVESYMAEIVEVLREINAPPEQIRQRALLRIRYSLSANRLEPARTAALEWLKTQPDDIQALDLLGTVAFKMNRLLEARDALARVYQTHPDNASAQRRYLKVLTQLDESDSAVELCRHILQTHADNPQSLQEVIETYIKFNQADQAQTTLTLLKQHPSDPAYLNYTRARIFQEKGDWESALSLFEKIDEDSPYHTDSLFRKGQCFSNLRHFEAAAEAYLAFLAINPDDTRALANLEQALARMRKNQGVQVIRDIRQSFSRRSAMQDEALYLERQGEVTRAAQLNARIAADQYLFNRAESILQNAIEQASDPLQAQINLADFYIQTLRAYRAEPILRSLLNYAPSSIQESIRHQLYKAQLFQGKTDDLQKAINSLPPDDPTLLILKSLIGTYSFELLGNAQKSHQWLNEPRMTLVSLRPVYLRILVELERYEDAYFEFTSIPKEYQDPKTLLAYVIALARMGKTQEARQLFDQTITENPDLSVKDTATAKAVLAEAEQSPQAPHFAKTAQTLEQHLNEIRHGVMRIHRDGWEKHIDLLFHLAKLQRKIGEHKQSIQFAQYAHQAKPDDTAVHRKLIAHLDQPQDGIERLYQIRQYRQKHGKTDFTQERHEVLAALQLLPEKP